MDTWAHKDQRSHGNIQTHGHMGREEAHPDTWSHEYQRTHVVTWTHTVTCTHADI